MIQLMYIIVATIAIAPIAFAGVFALAMKEHPLSKILPMLVSLSAGIPMGGSFIHLLPEAEKILGDFYGSRRICDAAVGTDIFTSLIADATPLSKREWRLNNQIATKTLPAIANQGGPRCCKRGSLIANIRCGFFT